MRILTQPFSAKRSIVMKTAVRVSLSEFHAPYLPLVCVVSVDQRLHGRLVVHPYSEPMPVESARLLILSIYSCHVCCLTD